MKRILLIGLEPSTVDYSDPAFPPGTTVEKMRQGIQMMIADAAARGWLAETCLVNPDETAIPTVERHLAVGRYDCVVVGVGLRLPQNRLPLFEAVINAIHRGAPQSPIAFKANPMDGLAAASRWIKD
jgi:hypothetical protein